MRRSQGELGFTLVETLVGLVILSAALLASYSTISNALKTVSRVAERRAAIEMVQQQVDFVRRQPLTRAQSFEGETESYRWRVSVEAVKGRFGRSVIPFRIVGRLMSKSVDGRFETVVDSIVLGRGA
jgi:prepilin-type N-terminal cleavage/methylation domain-containing protein